MINKEELQKLLDEKDYEKLYDIFKKEYIDTFKVILKHFSITIPENCSFLIEYINLIDSKFPENDYITHTPTYVFLSEHLDSYTKLKYAIKYHNIWINNINKLLERK